MANARVQERKAGLEVAKINLTYTEIRAPIAGRIGLAKYSEGNLVGPEAGPIAVILSQDRRLPIVGVNLWYHVGGANEAPGRSGFAHLFEHLMF